MNFKVIFSICLIILLPTSLIAFDLSMGWTIGSCTLNYDSSIKEGSGLFNILGMKMYEENLHLGVSTTGVSIPFNYPKFNSFSLLPTEIYYAPLNFGDFVNLGIFAKGEIEKLNEQFKPHLSFGIFLGMLLITEKEYLYYSPNASIKTFNKIGAKYSGTISMDIDFVFALAGIAILPAAIFFATAEEVQSDYYKNDPYYDKQDPFYN